jgi:predicted ATPase
VTGPNGSGKSNLYRALRLLNDVAHGQAIASLAKEGGLGSVMWAGPETISRRMKRGEVPVQGTRRQKPTSLRVGLQDEDLGYAIDFGIPQPSRSAFGFDPEIKRESIWHGDSWSRHRATVEREQPLIRARGAEGSWEVVTMEAGTRESILTFASDPRHGPETFLIREMIRGWRFYDHFRADRDAPARQPQIGTWTGALAHDGSDLAAALQTILEIGDPHALDAAVADAFPGAQARVRIGEGGFGLSFQQHGLLRPLDERELSDGTLRYLLWLAALMTPRPPPLLVLNEPETSLHPDLLEPLGRLIRSAARQTQVWVVSHAPRLIEVLRDDESCVHLQLQRELGETQVETDGAREVAKWSWPPR